VRLLKANAMPMKRGDVIRLSASGGGGFGPASERDPDALRYDVENGYVSEAFAREQYGYRGSTTA
jgi:N-methylhydantoinase B